MPLKNLSSAIFLAKVILWIALMSGFCWGPSPDESAAQLSLWGGLPISTEGNSCLCFHVASSFLHLVMLIGFIMPSCFCPERKITEGGSLFLKGGWCKQRLWCHVRPDKALRRLSTGPKQNLELVCLAGYCSRSRIPWILQSIAESSNSWHGRIERALENIFPLANRRWYHRDLV